MARLSSYERTATQSVRQSARRPGGRDARRLRRDPPALGGRGHAPDGALRRRPAAGRRSTRSPACSTSVGAPAPDRPIVAQSARNRFPGIVTRIERDGVAAVVEVMAGPHRLVSLLTAEAVERARTSRSATRPCASSRRPTSSSRSRQPRSPAHEIPPRGVDRRPRPGPRGMLERRHAGRAPTATAAPAPSPRRQRRQRPRRRPASRSTARRRSRPSSPR